MVALNGNWNYPNAIRFGAGRIAELAQTCNELGMKRPLLVTDKGLAANAMIENALNHCNDNGIECDVFSGVGGNPTGAQVEDGVRAFSSGNHDSVIAFGGGSSLDAGKAIAFMARQSRPLWDFEDVGDNWTRAETKDLPPVIAVPTTSGTGSEVGRASVITDEEARVKKIIFHPRMLPEIVIGDPELTLGLPPELTAATGMDALSHNLEAFFAPGYHPLARGIAVEGIRLVKENLQAAVHEGQNIEARAQMMAASMAGATAFQRGLGAMHALAHSLGALYNAHHGMLNAILMPYVLEANRSAIEAEAKYLARCLDIENEFGGVLDWVLRLREDVGIPHALSEIGIDSGEFKKVGRMALKDPSAGGNPIQFDHSEYVAIFQSAVRGHIPRQ